MSDDDDDKLIHTMQPDDIIMDIIGHVCIEIVPPS